MLRLLQGDVGSGKTLVALARHAGGGRGRRAGGDAGADRNPCQATSCDAAQATGFARSSGRDPDRPRKGQGARFDADGAGRRVDRHPRRHPRHFPGQGRLSPPRPRGDRRAASLRRLRTAAPDRQGGEHAASAGDDRDAHPADADADPIWRDGRQPDRRNAAGPHPDRDPRHRRGADRRRRRRARPPCRRGRPGLLGLSFGCRKRDQRCRRGRGAGGSAGAAFPRAGRAGPRSHEGAGKGRGHGRVFRRSPRHPCRHHGDRSRCRRPQRRADDHRRGGALRPCPVASIAWPGRAWIGQIDLPACCAAPRSARPVARGSR